MKAKIVFVTKGGEDCDEGFSYVLELAKSINSGITVLVVYPKNMMSTFEDVMAAAAFAEAGDFKTVKTLMDNQERLLREAERKKLADMSERSRIASIALTHTVAEGDPLTVIRDFLQDSPGIDMVLLSPALSANRKADIRKLIKNISKPIVHISRPLKAEV